MWKFLAWISLGTKIFQETLSMKAPSVASEFGDWRRAEIDREAGISRAHLSGLGVQMILHDVVEHLAIHQDVEDGVMSLLVDQRAGLERLIEALLDHLHDHSLGISLSSARHSSGITLSRSASMRFCRSAIVAAAGWPAA